MCCHVYYSTDNFETRSTMFEMKKMPANNPQYVEAKPVLTVKDGQQLLVRVYPWYNGTATGKTICLSDLTIHGMAVNITTVAEEGKAATAWFSVDGKQLQAPQRGLNIKRTVMADGAIETQKYFY